MSLVFYILSALFLIDGIVLSVRGNVSVGLFIIYGLSICCAVFAKFHKEILAFTASGALLWLRYIVIAGIVIYIGCMGLILSYSHTNVDYSEDVVIVLGCGVKNGRPNVTLQTRLDAAIEYYQTNSDIYIVAAGGLARQKDTTEAAVMRNYLLEKGIPDEKIVIEDKSQSTQENYRFAKEILDQKGIKYDSIVFVTNSFHIYRAKTYAEHCGFENAHALSTKTDLFVFVPALIREVLGVVDMWVFKLR
ncbi:MAG: YdcF family protein [Oscillospiraceae bacterium]|nr:YdcF family protein [Oscillospiraceae bacterium]